MMDYDQREELHRANRKTDDRCVRHDCRRALAESRAECERLRGALQDIDDWLADRADIVDGDYGTPAPDDEMQLRRGIADALGKYDG